MVNALAWMFAAVVVNWMLPAGGRPPLVDVE